LLIYSLPTLLLFVMVTLGVVALSIAGMLFIRKKVGWQVLAAHHDVTDPLVGVVGTLFAVILGFMVANSMARWEEARVNVLHEAGSVGDVFRMAGGLVNGSAKKIQTACLSYCDLVVDKEWQLMDDRQMSEEAWDVYGELWDSCLHYEPKTQGDSNVHAQLLSAMSEVGMSRRARFAQMSYALPPVLWVVVFVGAFATIAFTYLFGIENIRLQIALTTGMAVVLCLNVFLLFSFEDPFSGDVMVTSAPFQVARTNLRAVLQKRWR
jgi:hypothetical protein